jgi:hypothetical protein
MGQKETEITAAGVRRPMALTLSSSKPPLGALKNKCAAIQVFQQTVRARSDANRFSVLLNAL